MTVECLEALLAKAQDMLVTAAGLPRGPSREYALETVRQYVSHIAVAMDVVESRNRKRESLH
jgi:hypothetical protein